jgi:hypothetical protein
MRSILFYAKKNSISRVRSFYADRKTEKEIDKNVLKF